MEFDGDILTIGIDMSMEEITEFENFIRSRLDYIETIEVKEEGALKTAALIPFLISLKNTKPQLQIPFLKKTVTACEAYGTIHWICHD